MLAVLHLMGFPFPPQRDGAAGGGGGGGRENRYLLFFRARRVIPREIALATFSPPFSDLSPPAGATKKDVLCTTALSLSFLSLSLSLFLSRD